MTSLIQILNVRIRQWQGTIFLSFKIRNLHDFNLSLGPSVVEKVVDSRYRYDTEAMVPDFNLVIGDPMGSASDGKIGIGSVSVSEPDFTLASVLVLVSAENSQYYRGF